MKCIQLIFSGKVQGVYYRANAQKKALELGVNGYVQNQPDGSVCIEAEGEADLLKKFTEWCRKGPEKALVSSLLIKEIPSKNYSSFEIKR